MVGRSTQGHAPTGPVEELLNGLAVTEAGEFFATDDQEGIIYRIAAGSTEGEVYCADTLLRPTIRDGGHFGANGIRVFDSALYVTTRRARCSSKCPPVHQQALSPCTSSSGPFPHGPLGKAIRYSQHQAEGYMRSAACERVRVIHSPFCRAR